MTCRVCHGHCCLSCYQRVFHWQCVADCPNGCVWLRAQDEDT